MQYITSNQMTAVDKLAIEKYNISDKQLMENAGHGLARFVRSLNPKKVIILFGKGNNGGDGLVAARHLSIYGIPISIIGRSGNENVIHQLKTLEKMKVVAQEDLNADEIEDGDIIIDALLGYTLTSNPRDNIAELINKINNLRNNKKIKVVSIDIESGKNGDGLQFKPHVKADFVLTLAIPKKGMENLENLYLADIGIPNQVYEELGIEPIRFNEDIIRLS